MAISYARVPEGYIDTLEHKRHKGKMVERAPENIIAVSFETDRTMDRERFLATLSSLAERVLRLKGHINFGEGPHYCEVVYDRIYEKPELTGPSSKTAFTIIAYQTDKDELTEMFERTFESS